MPADAIRREAPPGCRFVWSAAASGSAAPWHKPPWGTAASGSMKSSALRKKLRKTFGQVRNMAENQKYQKTLAACYLGFVTQAIAANFAPLLFLTFQNAYRISLEKITLIPVVFYLTQLLIDLVATKFADKIGYRICAVISQAVSAAGLVLLAVLPEVLPVPFLRILIAVVFYAIGSGLVEVLVSPIVGSLPL